MPRDHYLSQVIWFNSTIGLPLDTVSVVISQYNKSVLRSTTTVYGDLASFSWTLPQALTIQDKIEEDLAGIEGPLFGYGEFADYVLGNTTDEAGVNSPSDPTPYIAIDGFVLWTSVSGPCDKDLATTSQVTCNTCWTDDSTAFVIRDGGNFPGFSIGSTSISLTTTFYAPLYCPATYPTAVLDRVANASAFIELPLSSFIEFISSETQLLMSLPILASCSYFPEGVGPPALKFPVSALTATVTATTTESSLDPPGISPTPANLLEPPIGPPTTQLVPPPTPTTQVSPHLAGTDTPLITFGGSKYTADTSANFVIDGQTLAPGGVITINGTPVSYAAAGTDVVIGASTEAVGMGKLIMSGVGNGPNGPANMSVMQFTGDALSQNKPAKGALMMLSGVFVLAIA